MLKRPTGASDEKFLGGVWGTLLSRRVPQGFALRTINIKNQHLNQMNEPLITKELVTEHGINEKEYSRLNNSSKFAGVTSPVFMPSLNISAPTGSEFI